MSDSASATKRTANVFDACAMLAFLGREVGADVVDRLLLDSANECLAHAVNMCEVYYDIVRRDGVEAAQRAIRRLGEAKVQTRSDLDTDFWQQVGNLKVNPGRISLADCFGVALTQREGATFVTSDRHEFECIDELGVCPILFIR